MSRKRRQGWEARDVTASPDDLGDAANERSSRVVTVATCVGLALVVLLTYAATARFDFVNFDDDAHVTDNEFVSTGLSAKNIVWAFGVHGPSQWHPLAWISHQFDCMLFGVDAGSQHAMNVGLHAAASIVMFLSLLRMTSSWGVAAFVAAAFALHPLNVESVAWISERRNVLCALFWSSTMLAWQRYSAAPSLGRYTAALAGHAAALMSKPLAVTLPCVLLMLDIWPLDRRKIVAPSADTPPDGAESNGGGTSASISGSPRGSGRPASIGRLFAEKIPFLALSVVSGVLTILCQRAVGTVASIDEIPMSLRMANAVVSYGWYLQKAVWPSGLACFYPHPALFDAAPWDRLTAACLVSAFLLGAITVVVARHRRWPWLAVGWFWFLGVSAPMIGLVQVGHQQFADRYAYLPLVGLFLMAAEWGREWSRRGAAASRRRARLVSAAACVALATWGWLSHRQAEVWRDSATLFSHALEATGRNHWAHNNLGMALLDQGRPREAANHFLAAVEIVPNYALGHYNLGVALHEMGSVEAAAARFAESLKHDSASPKAHQRLGALLAERGQLELALRHFREAARLAPNDFQARLNLGVALARAEAYDAALRELKIAETLRPGNAQIRGLIQSVTARQRERERDAP